MTSAYTLIDDKNGDNGERLVDTVTSQLRQDILFGVHKPASKLKQSDLRNRYEASSNTIREALAHLVAEGLVEAKGQRGFTVADVSLADLADITQTRILLESQAVRLSLAVADLHWEGEVMAAHYRLTKIEELANQDHAQHRTLLEQYDSEFHRTLIAGCNSPWILRFHATMYDHMLRYRSLACQVMEAEELSASLRRSQHDHLILRDAALAKDADRLIELLDVHIRKGEEFAQKYDV